MKKRGKASGEPLDLIEGSMSRLAEVLDRAGFGGTRQDLVALVFMGLLRLEELGAGQEYAQNLVASIYANPGDE